MVLEVQYSEELLLDTYGATHPGKRRECNEDVVLLRDDLHLYVVCDGAGGHDAGDVASTAAVRTIAKHFIETAARAQKAPVFDVNGIATGARRLCHALQKANRFIWEMSKSAQSKRGMGSTCVAACFTPAASLMHVVHVGDSRAYRWRNGHLDLLTQDHSVINEVIEQRPDLDDAVLGALPRHAVTRALGMEERLRVSFSSFEVVNGDRYMLCTDGLTGPVPPMEVAAALGSGEDPRGTVEMLIALANDAGGPDNIAVAVIDCRSPRSSALPVEVSVADLLPDGPSHSEPEILLLGIEELDLRTLSGGDPEISRMLESLLKR